MFVSLARGHVFSKEIQNSLERCESNMSDSNVKLYPDIYLGE